MTSISDTESNPKATLTTVETSDALDMLVVLAQAAARKDGGDRLDLLGMLRLIEIQVQGTRRAVVSEARSLGYTAQEIADTLAIDVAECKRRYGMVSDA